MATALATTIGVVAGNALGSTGNPNAATQTSGTGGTSSTTTTTTLPPALASGPDQSHAPAIPTGGGGQPGYGNFNAVACADATHCLAVGTDDQGNGVASFSADGGTSWDSSSLPNGVPVLDAVSCSDSAHCVAVGQGAIVVTTDQGANWALEALPTANTTLIGADCPSTSLCVATGVIDNPTGPFGAAVMRSTDGGSSWQEASLPPGTLGIGDVACPSSTDCIAVGASLLVSHDGGATWAATTVPGGTGPLRTVSCASTTSCIAIGDNAQGLSDPNAGASAIESTDGGNTWTSVSFPAGTATLDQVSCDTATQCVAGGLSPTAGGSAPLFQSNDGGTTWTKAVSPPNPISEIAGISCPALNQCAVVGRQSNRKAATAATSDLSTWATTTLPGQAVPPSTDAVS